ncbi:hypothetical protein A2V68_03090 [candidate division Kazan bacterium RBG_13_50_9]|uniref:PEP-utilising enzyme mobile domain-containing protein n=1 Tax=candidate division Kazan bacterium RBG_13_50_9 TaxID=1798535 RepID=A0A1F4NSY3_UNCK3|nr:MAG: hypothetical protein A2V68_03090 [candidate division Kazan bacterium RBG_13_50_9]
MTKDQTLKYLREHKFDIAKAKAALIAGDIVFSAYVESDKITGVNYSPVFSYFGDKPPFYQIVVQFHMDSVGDKLYTDYLKDSKSLNKKIAKHQALTDKLDLFWAQYQKAKARKALSRADLLKWYKQLRNISTRWWYYGVIGEDKGQVIDRRVTPDFMKRHKLSQAQAEEIINVLSHPDEQAIFSLERKEFLNLCLYVQKHREAKSSVETLLKDIRIQTQVQHYIDQFFWFKTDFYDTKTITPRSLITDTLGELSQNPVSKIRKELTNIDKKFKDIHMQKQKLVAKMNLSKEDRQAIYFAQRVTHWVDQRKLGTMKNLYYLFNLLSDIAKHFGLTYHQASFYTVDEVERLLSTGKPLSAAELSARTDGVFLVYEKGHPTQTFYSPDSQEMLAATLQTDSRGTETATATMDNKESILKYLRGHELDVLKAKGALWIGDMAFSAYANSYKVAGINYSPVFSYFSSKFPFYKIVAASHHGLKEQVGDKLYEEYLKNPEILDKKIAKHQEIVRRLDQLWQKYEKAKSQDKFSRKDWLTWYAKFIDAATKWWHYGVIGEDKGYVIDRRVMPEIIKRHQIGPEKAREVTNILSHPDEPAIFSLERKSFLGICLYIKRHHGTKSPDTLLKDKGLSARLKNHIDNYFWSKTDFYSAQQITPQSLLKDAAEEISKRSLPDIKKEIIGIDKRFAHILAQRKQLMRRMKLSPADKKDLYFARRVVYWVDQRKLGMAKHFYYLFNFLSDIANHFGFTYHQASQYTVNELRNLLATGKKLSKRELTRRDAGVLLVHETDQPTQMFSGSDSQEILTVALQTDTKEIKGMVASTGGKKRLTGVARILFSPEDGKFNDGEVLVTSMTRVEFVPLMRRAKAIITDEGGLACHAAIVSREMGLPCIIGTKNATQVLKSGDKIEIDLEQGAVKAI